MQEMKRELRSMIVLKFDSESACAEYLGWPKQRLNKITNGKKEPSVSELCEIAKAVDCSVTDLANIFLQRTSPNGQRS